MMDIDKAKEVLSTTPSIMCHNSIVAVQALASILVAQHEELMNKLDSLSTRQTRKCEELKDVIINALDKRGL